MYEVTWIEEGRLCSVFAPTYWRALQWLADVARFARRVRLWAAGKLTHTWGRACATT